MHISKSKTFFNVKSSTYHFNIKMKILAYFQICISVPLSFAYYIEAFSYRDTLYFVYLSLCLRLGLFMSYLCDLSYLFILFFIIIFIFITINYIISLRQKNLSFEHVSQKFSLRVLLSFCLIFRKFQPGVAYKSVAYKKSMYLKKNCSLPFSGQTFSLFKYTS